VGGSCECWAVCCALAVVCLRMLFDRQGLIARAIRGRRQESSPFECMEIKCTQVFVSRHIRPSTTHTHTHTHTHTCTRTRTHARTRTHTSYSPEYTPTPTASATPLAWRCDVRDVACTTQSYLDQRAATLATLLQVRTDVFMARSAQECRHAPHTLALSVPQHSCMQSSQGKQKSPCTCSFTCTEYSSLDE
jgi:hypothetical protein